MEKFPVHELTSSYKYKFFRRFHKYLRARYLSIMWLCLHLGVYLYEDTRLSFPQKRNPGNKRLYGNPKTVDSGQRGKVPSVNIL